MGLLCFKRDLVLPLPPFLKTTMGIGRWCCSKDQAFRASRSLFVGENTNRCVLRGAVGAIEATSERLNFSCEVGNERDYMVRFFVLASSACIHHIG